MKWIRSSLACALVGCVVSAPLSAQTSAPPPAASAASAAAAPAAMLPAKLFYRAPDIESAVLSPSGRWLALITAIAGKRTALSVFDLKEWKVHAVVARFSDIDVADPGWVNDEVLVFDVQDRTLGGGDQRWWPGLFSVRRDGTQMRMVVKVSGSPIDDRPGPGREPLEVNHELLHVPATGGTEVIVGEWRYKDYDFLGIDAKRVDVLTGKVTNLSLGTPKNVHRWMFDSVGEPRLVVTRRDDKVAYHWRDPGSNGWRLLDEFVALKETYVPRSIDREGALYVSVRSGANGESDVRRFDFKTGRPEAQPLVSTPGFDVTGGVLSETQGSAALGVRVNTDAETTVWFDARLKALQAEADKRFPGRVNRITCRRCNEPDMTAVVLSYSDQDPGQIWVYRAADTSWRKVGSRRQDVDPRQMAITDFARIRARDGLEIPVWVTLPPGPKQQARPAVVLVHGGPWVRGRYWGWDDNAQFLASRGYVVIEPEFRGSTGYGNKLFRAGFHQWGQAMQDDVSDALAWAVGQGWVDKSRVCIAGASYGGYATLMGLVRNPDQYRCGVAWVAVTDPRLLFEWNPTSNLSDEARRFDLPTLIGNPKTDAAMLDANSPVLQAARIKAPVLLAVGGADGRVPATHGRRMRDALKQAGRPPEYVEYVDEGHGFFKLENEVDFAERMEKFLAQHLK